MSETNDQVPEGGAGRAGERRPALRLGPVTVKAREEMTSQELWAAARDNQAGNALESEVRQLGWELGLGPEEIQKLGAASRRGFRIVNGDPVPVAGDGQTVVLSGDGVNTLSVTEWVARNSRGLRPETGGQGGGHWQDLAEEAGLPVRNPFRRKTWNLTEQMRLQRRDPRLARRLLAQAEAE